MTIDGGTFRLSTKDDSIHADLDVTISGGDFQIETEDDGVHAARNLTVNSGTFNIPVCYEGFEATNITFNGGRLRLNSPADPYYEGCLLCNGRVTVTGGYPRRHW